MSDFHAFVSRLLAIWLVTYVAILLLALAQPLALFVIACFKLSPIEAGSILNTLRTAAFWLIPTAFLWTAYYLSIPQHRKRFQGNFWI
jgi:hypothetical protein